MRYTADPLIRLGLRPDYTEAFDSMNSAIAGISTTSSSFWEADSPGIRYPGHIAVGTSADVNGIGQINSLLQDIFGGGTFSSVSNIQETFTGTPPVYSNGLNLKVASNYASTPTSVIGIEAVSATLAGNTAGSFLMAGFFGGMRHSGTGTVTQAYGVPGIVQLSSAGTITNAAGLYGAIINNSSGTISDAFALLVGGATNSGGGAITNNFGLYIQRVIAGTTNYNMYSEGFATDNYFDGYVRTAAAGGFYMNAAGSVNNRFKINEPGTGDSAAECIITPSTSARIPMVYEGAIGQTAVLNRWQDTSGNMLAQVGATGKISVGNSALGSDGLDVFTAGSNAVAIFQGNGMINGSVLVGYTVGNAVTGTVYGYKVSGSTTNNLYATVQQNGAGNAIHEALVLGAGDAYSLYNINGGAAWSVGLDNSDSDSFRISGHGTFGTNDYFRIANSSGDTTISPGGVVQATFTDGTASPYSILELAPTNRNIAYSSSVLGAFIRVDNTYTTTASNSIAPIGFDWNPTVIFGTDGYGFGSEFLMWARPTIQNSSGSTRTLGPTGGFVEQHIIQANGGTLTAGFHIGFLGQPTFNRINSGTLNVTRAVEFLSNGFTIGAGTTVTEYGHFAATDGTNSGTLTTQIGLSIGSLTSATNNTHILIGTATTGNWGIYQSTSTGNYLNGDLLLGTTLTFLKETAHTIQIADTTTAATAGGALTIKGAAGSATTSGAGGAINITAGAAQAGISAGGAVNIKGGAGFIGGSILVDVGGGFAGATMKIGSVTATPTAFGNLTPTATVHIKAGATAASSAPLKFTTGTNMTTAEVGAMEFTTGRLYFTPVLTRNIITSTTTTNTTAVGNITTGEDDLMTYSVPANTMGTDGDYMSFRASGTIANNANAKRIRIKYGATTILDTGAAGLPASVAASWKCEAEVIRTGAATQKCSGKLEVGNGTTYPFVAYVTAAETLSGAVTFKLTGEATSTDDIIQETLTARLN